MRLYYTKYIKSILIDGIHGKSILIDGIHGKSILIDGIHGKLILIDGNPWEIDSHRWESMGAQPG